MKLRSSLQGVLASGKAPIAPLPGSRPVYWFWNELGELGLGTLLRARFWTWQGVRGACQAVQDTAARLSGGVDAVLDPEDPLPFLALHYGQVRPLYWVYRSLRVCGRRAELTASAFLPGAALWAGRAFVYRRHCSSGRIEGVCAVLKPKDPLASWRCSTGRWAPCFRHSIGV